MTLVTLSLLSLFSKLLSLIKQRSKLCQSWGNSTDLLLLFGLSYHFNMHFFNNVFYDAEI